MIASLILRPSERSGDRNMFLASCWVSELPPCTTVSLPGVGGKRAERAHDVDAEMLEEAPVLGGERRLDHDVGDFVERHRVVAQQAALADLVAEAVEEGDAVLVGEVHLALRGLEGGKREGGEHEEAADAERQPLAGKLVERRGRRL